MSTSCLERLRQKSAIDAELWLVDLDAYARDEALNGLAAEEHARAARMVFQRDARRYLAGRHALRRVLADALDRSSADLVIESDAFGKPHLVSSSGIQFNVSHSAQVALIGVSRKYPIGVDIEMIRTLPDADALSRSYFTDEERAEWSSAEPPGDVAFLSCWTRKEACLKALGIGLSGCPRTFNAGCAPELRRISIPLGTQRYAVTVHSPEIAWTAVAAVALAESEDVMVAR
jgi:4'-phosphopantetheinyl transferase